MELTTLGNFGRLSVAHSKDGLDSINSTATGGYSWAGTLSYSVPPIRGKTGLYKRRQT